MNRTTKRTKIHPIDIHVSHRLKKRRLQARLGLNALGDLVGVTAQQIQKYELGQDRISAGRLYLLAGALQVSVGYFFQGLSQPLQTKSTRSKLSTRLRSGLPGTAPDG